MWIQLVDDQRTFVNTDELVAIRSCRDKNGTSGFALFLKDREDPLEVFFPDEEGSNMSGFDRWLNASDELMFVLCRQAMGGDETYANLVHKLPQENPMPMVEIARQLSLIDDDAVLIPIAIELRLKHALKGAGWGFDWANDTTGDCFAWYPPDWAKKQKEA